MDVFLDYLKAFLVGGLFCIIAQILIDKTNATPGKILVGYVTAGAVLSAVGLYKPFADWAGAGASVPLTGFGHLLAEGAKKGVEQNGFFGALTGGVTAAAAGITAAVVFGYVFAIISKPKDKK